jgi:hypothetical protein
LIEGRRPASWPRGAASTGSISSCRGLTRGLKGGALESEPRRHEPRGQGRAELAPRPALEQLGRSAAEHLRLP